jgi:hypothetical protein
MRLAMANDAVAPGDGALRTFFDSYKPNNKLLNNTPTTTTTTNMLLLRVKLFENVLKRNRRQTIRLD